MAEPFQKARDAALALLNGTSLDWKAAGFVGQLTVADRPLSDKQLGWLSRLLRTADLPPLADGGQHD